MIPQNRYHIFRYQHLIIVTILFFGTTSSLQAKQNTLNLSIDLKLTDKKNLNLSGTLLYTLEKPQKEQCFYLPFLDREYVHPQQVNRRFETLYQMKETPILGNIPKTKVSINEANTSLNFITDSVVKTTSLEALSSVSLKFSSILPSFLNQEGEYLAEGFYPIPLTSCPEKKVPVSRDKFSISKIQAKINSNEDMMLIGQEGFSFPVKGSHILHSNSRKLAFVLGKKWDEENLKSQSSEIVIFYKNREFLETQKETILHAISQLEKILGTFEFQKLSIVETSLSHSLDLKGLITVNKPSQPFMTFLQSKLLNWNHWYLSSLLMMQHYGACIVEDKASDKWLIDGFVDFLTQESVKTSHIRNNLFNTFEVENPYFSFNYLQTQEATAFLLYQNDPQISLTSKDFQSIKSYDDQNPYLFVRHALALRHLQTKLGKENFFSLLKAFTQSYSCAATSPIDFYEFVEHSQIDAKNHHEASRILKQWWSLPGWPNFQLTTFSKSKLDDNRWLAHIKIKQNGSFGFDVPVQVSDLSNNNYYSLSKPELNNPDEHNLYVITEVEPTKVQIDPFHTIFDIDRFDHTSQFPSFTFFPGNASTISDQDYTTFWLPYILRRAGETTVFGFQGSSYRYLQNKFVFKAEYSLADKALYFQLLQKFYSPKLYMDGFVSFSKNRENEIVGLLGIEKKIPFEPGSISIFSKVSARKTIIKPYQAYHTISAGVKLKNAKNHLFCQSYIFNENEFGNSFEKPSFSYQRLKAVGQFVCPLFYNINAGISFFKGLLLREGNTPDASYFRVNSLDEAGVRVDDRRLPFFHEVRSFSLNILFPLKLNLIKSLPLFSKESLRFVTFLDGGSTNEQSHLGYIASGAGIILPIGGDVLGAGSLTLSHFSLLGVFYTKVDSSISLKPKILFSLASEL